jgi:hypothetical protein
MLSQLGERYGVETAEQIRHYNGEIPTYVTQRLSVAFRRPVLLDEPLQLIGQCISFEEGRYSAQLYSAGKLSAEAEAVWKPLRKR